MSACHYQPGTVIEESPRSSYIDSSRHDRLRQTAIAATSRLLRTIRRREYREKLEDTIESDPAQCRRVRHRVLLCCGDGLRLTDPPSNWLAGHLHDVDVVFAAHDWLLSRPGSRLAE